MNGYKREILFKSGADERLRVLKEVSEQVVLGQISGVYGVKGWVKVFSYTTPPSNILHYHTRWTLQFDGRSETVKVDFFRSQGKGFVAHIVGCDDRDEARRYIGAEIVVERDALPPLPSGEYYWRDLIGLDVVTTAGVVLGRVDHLIETGANDVLVVKGEREILIPYLMDKVIKQVDLENQQLLVDWDPEVL